jgi:hypothetical protein
MSERNAAFIAGIESINSNIDSFEILKNENVRVLMPEGYSIDHIRLAMKDGEILTSILNKNPEEVLCIMKAVSSGKLSEAKKAAAAIGISEENFVEQGGGLIGWVIFVIACGVLLTHD